VLEDKEQLDEAIDHFRKAIEFDPTHAPAHNNLALALSRKGQMEEAIGYFREAIKFYPKAAAPLFNLGNALMYTNQKDEAIRLLPPGDQTRTEDRRNPLQPGRCPSGQGPE